MQMYKDFDMRGLGKQSTLGAAGFGMVVDGRFVCAENKKSANKRTRHICWARQRWTQTMNFVDVYLQLDPHVTLAKELLVCISPRRVQVALRANVAQPLLSGELWGEVRPDDCSWTLEDGVLHLELAKLYTDRVTTELKKGFWRGLLVQGPLLDAVRIPPDYYDTHLNDRDAGRL